MQIRAARDADIEPARALWQRLARLIGLCFAESNPAPLKALLAQPKP